jgi:hypothetical protein
MIIDRTHRPWALATVILTVVIAVIYFATFTESRDRYLHESIGGTPLGLIYGILALLIFIFAALLGWRRNHPALRVGRMQFWLKGHIWFTVLTIPLVTLHSGFHWGSMMTQILMWTYWLVMASGFLGLGLQHVLPRIMFNRIKEEVVFEQIPYLREKLASRASELKEELDADPPEPEPAGEDAAESEPVTAIPKPTALIASLESEVLPYLQLDNGQGHKLDDSQTGYDLFQAMRLQSDDHWHPAIEELESLTSERRLLDQQTRLQHWLHGWLFFHGPVSLLLIILTLWHAIYSLINY